ncbi:hypothetical protein JYU21_02505 [Alkaliphilus sp. AH-315-G20]|nr:hypothetical protein [Alkaliphilus sp. AH-315-G20]
MINVLRIIFTDMIIDKTYCGYCRRKRLNAELNIVIELIRLNAERFVTLTRIQSLFIVIVFTRKSIMRVEE